MEDLIHNLKASLHTGFIDEKYPHSGSYKPRLLVNDIDKNQAVLTSLMEELETSESFLFSIAFITEGGLAMLKSQLLDLKRKGIEGRILTSTFLHFNQPKAFRELLKIANVEVRLTDVKGFHAKGYIFKQPNCYSLIVGSSNLTASALKVNYEWNIKLTSHENGEIIHHFKNQFEDVWEKSQPLTSEWIQNYEKQYEPAINEKNVQQVIELPVTYEVNSIEEALKIQPNKMQKAALEGIQAIRDERKEKGLIISATGTGKTYLSAFDVRRFAPRRMLFIVHREQILKKAKEDFRKILGGAEQDFGILSGSQKESDAKYLFATVQTISNDDTLKQFARDHFDYILIDEAHKAGAASYHRIIDYFTPKFLLGMTATPERTDGFNIYELFDYNIAYEIRLQEALEEDMLCPFFYFGVTDFTYNGELIDDTAQLSNLVNKERVNHIMEKVSYYGYSGEKVRGLIFCSRKEEAKELSNLLNERGYRTCALTGDDSQGIRENRVRELEEGLLDYILTVDIFNEGIDIPSINQVAMLRQTQSSIIFIQQLGRGLRKHGSKDFVTVIDFIGNYKNNYLIPVALSGDHTQNKDNIRRRVKDTSYIKGISTINFEEIAKKQIFQSINTNKLTAPKVLREAYHDLKNRIGRIPYLQDFIANHSIDPVVLVGKGNYYQFLEKMKEDIPPLTKYEQQVLTMFSQEILNGKRKHEIVLLEMLMENGNASAKEYISRLKTLNCIVDDETLASVRRIFELSFFVKQEKENYGNQPIVTLQGNKYRFNKHIYACLKNNFYFQNLVLDVIKSANEKSAKYENTKPLTLYEKYTRKDVCRVLNWDKNEMGTINGYRVKHQTCPIFVKYHKGEEVESSINYEDEFLSQEVLKWYTKNNRTLYSNEIQPIIAAEEQGIAIHIFVLKDDGEGNDFYYLGKAIPDKGSVKQGKIKNKDGKDLPIVHMNMVLEQEVEHNLYQYLISG